MNVSSGGPRHRSGNLRINETRVPKLNTSVIASGTAEREAYAAGSLLEETLNSEMASKTDAGVEALE